MSVKTIVLYSCDNCAKHDLTAAEVFQDSVAVASVDGRKILTKNTKSRKHYCEDCARQMHDLPPVGATTDTAVEAKPKSKRGRKPAAVEAEPEPEPKKKKAKVITEDDEDDDEAGE